MIVSNESLHKVDNHWAVLAIGDTERNHGLKVANARLVTKAVGQQIQFAFPETPSDSELLRRLAMAYEMAAIEGLGAFLNPTGMEEEMRQQCAAGAWRAFEFYRLFNLPERTEDCISHVLHISALAYCGDRWSDLRRWYNENEKDIQIPSTADIPWDQKLLYNLFECWLCLFRKRSWDDIDRVSEIVTKLREDQRLYESGVLNNGSISTNQTMALRLIALYHWAKATELLALYMLQGEPADIITRLDKHFEMAVEASVSAYDAKFEVLLRWIHAASCQMVIRTLTALELFEDELSEIRRRQIQEALIPDEGSVRSDT